MAETARIDGTVDGDLISFSRSLTVSGSVTGDVIAFGAIVRINGSGDGNVRAFGDLVSLSGTTVRKNVTAFCGHFELDPKSRVGGGMMLFAGEATLDGRTARDFLGFIVRTSRIRLRVGKRGTRGEKRRIGFRPHNA